MNPNDPNLQGGGQPQEDFRLQFIDYFQAPGARVLAVVLGLLAGGVTYVFTTLTYALLVALCSTLLVALALPVVFYSLDAPYRRIKKTIPQPLLLDERVRFTVKGGKSLGGFFLLTEQSMIFLSVEGGDHRLELARADVKTVMLTEEKYSVRIFLSDTQFVEVLSAVYREIFDVLRENNWNVTVS